MRGGGFPLVQLFRERNLLLLDEYAQADGRRLRESGRVGVE
jgi:hypothetical protein